MNRRRDLVPHVDHKHSLVLGITEMRLMREVPQGQDVKPFSAKWALQRYHTKHWPPLIYTVIVMCVWVS